MSRSFWRRALTVSFCLLLSAAPAAADPPASKGAARTVKRSGRSPYIVQLAAPPVARYHGGVAGLAPTSPRARGERKLDSKSPDSRRYTAHLIAEQRQALAAARRALGRELGALHHYTQSFNGFAVELTEAEAQALARQPGIARVEVNRNLRPLTDVGPAWIGAPGIWDGSATGGLPGTKGEGIVVGMIDTGINMDHPSFADLGGDGYDHTNPRGAGNYVGWCDPVNPDYDPSLACNDKLIGVWSYPETGYDPEDDNGHGSHTASTVAGNHAILDLGGGILRHVSGVAPHANLIAYDVCQAFGCPVTALLAAADQAVADGVDVINYSIGGFPVDDPWDDVLGASFLAVREAGVFVAAAAGNNGPFSSSILRPAFAPWVLAAGAATHDRASGNALAGLSGGAATPPPDLTGGSLTGGYGPAGIVHAEDFGDHWCDFAFAAGTFSGQIVVCDYDFFQSVQTIGQNVLAGGAGGVVLANVFFSDPTTAQGNALPAVHLDAAKSNQLRTWLNAGSGHTGTITASATGSDPAAADILAWFSSRGPNPFVPEVVKPDLVAPGVNVLAASKDPEDGDLLSGTSMASPHAAGAAALLVALHPTWTPAEVQSALMTTAKTTGLKLDSSTPASSPFDVGAGRVDLSAAGRAGLVLDVTIAELEAADPEAGGDPATLNLASLADACVASAPCAWTRTVRSTLADPAEWTVSTSVPVGMSVTVTPASFTLAPGATQTLQISATNDAALSGWKTGSIRLTESGGLAPEAHLPLAVRWSQLYEVAVTKTGGGTGRVTSNPPGIDCGGVCAAIFLEGTSVVLTATPDPGQVFLGWGGDCFGSNPTCSVTAWSNRSVIAYFDEQAEDRALANGVPIKDDISSPFYYSRWNYYFADLASGTGELVVDLFDMSGDVDLFVRHEQKPDFSSYDCADWFYGTPNRRCVITAPAGGRWWIGVNNGDTGLIQYSVRASWGTSLAHALQSGVPVDDYVSHEIPGGGWKYYFADIAGGGELLVELSGLSADADLFVRWGAKPDRSNYDCVSSAPSTLPESCRIAPASAGRWWIGVNNFSAGTVTYRLQASFLPAPPAVASDFYTLTPCRLLDTRQAGPALAGGVPRLMPLAALCGVPPTAKAVSLNVTVVGPSGAGHVVLYPGDTPPPLTSTINFKAGQTRANNAIIQLAADLATLGMLAVLPGSGQVHLLLDVNGYFE